jgi:hypothetical protein
MSGVSLLEYLDLPTIPDEWLLSLDQIKQLPLYSPKELEEHNLYFLRQLNDNRIIDLLQPYFDFDITEHIFYQYIGANLGIHTDFGRKTAINYIINTGGDKVVTKWFSGAEVIFQEIIPEKRWHKIVVSINHCVENVATDRYAITIHRIGK